MKSLCNTEVVDVIGVGIGPSNLSLAALLSPIKTFPVVFMIAMIPFHGTLVCFFQTVRFKSII